MTLIPVSFETCGKIKIRPLPNYAFAAGTPLVPLCATEIVAFSHEIPLVFVADGEETTLAALTGLSSNRNMLIDESGRWHGSHIPAMWRRGPFRLAPIAGNEDGKLALCLDDSSEQLSETDGRPLFDENAQPTELLGEVSSLLGKLEKDLRHTRTICKLVKSLDLLIPWNIDIPKADGSKIQLKGLLRIDEEKIGTLSGDDLIALRDCGGLAAAYAHLFSMSKIGLLAKISQQLAHRDRQQEAVKSNKVDLDRAFGIVEDDPFIF